MTVSTTSNKITYDGNASTTVWSFSFPGVDEDDLEVYFLSAAGVETLLSPSAYTVILNAPVGANPTGVGGLITYPLSGSPIALGTSLTIIRVLPETQSTSLANQGTLLPKVIEAALDYVTMITQQIQETLGRQITVAVSDPNPEPLPPVAERADLWAAFDSDGNMIAADAPSGGVPISSAMQPVVAAASLALARTALGLGDLAILDIGVGLQDDGAGAVRVNFGSSTVSTNQSVLITDHLKQYEAVGALLFTLDKASDLFSGFGFSVNVLSGTCVFAIDAADTIYGLASGVSLTVPAGCAVTFITDAQASGSWWARVSQLARPSSLGYLQPMGVALSGTRGLKIVNKSGTENTSITVTADRMVLTGSNGLSVLRTSVSFDIDLTTGTATSAAGGMDGEARGTSAWLYLFAIDNGDAIAGLASLESGNGLSPTLPTNYPYSAYLGAVRVDSLGNLLRTWQYNNRVQYVVTAGANTTDWPSITSGTTGGVATAVSITPVVPATAIEIWLYLLVITGQQGTVGPTIDTNANNMFSANNVSGETIRHHSSILLQGTTVSYSSAAGGQELRCTGWIDGKTN